MYTFSVHHSQKRSQNNPNEVQYLALASEPKEITTIGRVSFGYHSRYLAKRRLMRRIRVLRHD